MYTTGLASITIQTNSANREKEAATVEVTKVHGAVRQHCMYIDPAGPRRALLAFPEAFWSPRAASVRDFASEMS